MRLKFFLVSATCSRHHRKMPANSSLKLTVRPRFSRRRSRLPRLEFARRRATCTGIIGCAASGARRDAGRHPAARNLTSRRWADCHRATLTSNFFHLAHAERRASLNQRRIVIFDERSFRLNDEVNVNVYDGGIAKEMETMFFEDLACPALAHRAVHGTTNRHM